MGTRAGLFGNETGRFEAWVYPLKLFRDFHLIFHVGDRALPAESSGAHADGTARSRRRSCTRAILFASRNALRAGQRSGRLILLDVETEQPLEIEAAFTGDFQLEWPAALGERTSTGMQRTTRWFGEEARKFAGWWGPRPRRCPALV